MRVPTKPLSSLRLAASRLAGFLVLIALLALALPARALAAGPADASGLSALEAALQRRIDSFHPQGRGQLAEKRQLEAALARLQTYAGLLESYRSLQEDQWTAATADAQTLVAVAVRITRSKTRDTGIREHVEAVRRTLDDFALEARQTALTSIPLLLTPTTQQAIEVRVGKGDELRSEALEAWPVDFGAGARTLTQAILHQHRVAVLGVEEVMAEAVRFPVDVEPGEVTVPIGEEPTASEPFELDVQAALTRTVPELTIAVRAVSVEQVTTARGTQSPRSQATIGVKTFRNVDPEDTLEPITVEVPPFADEQRVIHAGVLGYGGGGVDIDYDTAVVGSGGNFVTVFERNQGGIEAWHATAKLEIPAQFAQAEGSKLGSVAISGDTIVVGDINHDAIPGGVKSGAAFVFQRDAAGGWAFVQRLAPEFENPFFLDDVFGGVVDISGDRIVVGSLGHINLNHYLGAAYVFARNEGGSDAWGMTQAIYNRESEGDFGYAVAIDGNFLVIGSPGTMQNPTSVAEVHVYYYEGEWFRYGIQRMQGSNFGSSLAIDESIGILVVGAPDYDVLKGAVVVYNMLTTSSQRGGWPEWMLQAPSPSGGDRYGHSVAISSAADDLGGSMILVGSPGHDDAGSAYVYVHGHVPGCPPVPVDPKDSNPWGLLARRVSDAPQDGALFGRDLAISPAHVSNVLVDGQSMEIQVPATFLVNETQYYDGSGWPGKAHILNGMDPVIAGEYQLAIEVDPHHRVLEMSGGAETNNLQLTDTKISVCVPALDQPDLSVLSAELVPKENGVGFIIGDVQGNQITPAGLNVTVQMTGSFDGPLRDVYLKTVLIYDGGEIEGKVKDPVTGEHTAESLRLPDMFSGDTVSVHMDVEYQGFEAPLGNSKVILDVQVYGRGDIDGDNDKWTLVDQNWTAIDITGCNSSSMYGKQMGNDEFNVAIDFQGSLGGVTPSARGDVGPGIENGAVGSLSAEAGFSVFGYDVNDVVDFHVLAERDPICVSEIGTGYSLFEASLEVLGYTIYSVGPYDSFSVLDFVILPEGLELEDPPGTGFKMVKEFSKDQSFPDRDKEDCCLPSGSILELTEAECCTLGGFLEQAQCGPHAPAAGPCRELPRLGRTFFPAGVPVDVDAAAEGEIGLELGIEVSDNMTFNVNPYVSLGVSLDVKVPGGSPIHAGVKGELTLIKDDFNIASGLFLEVLRQDDDVQICMTQGYKVENTISFLSGKIVAYAVYPWFELWDGFYLARSEFDIINWNAPFGVKSVIADETNGPCTLIPESPIYCPTGKQVVR